MKRDLSHRAPSRALAAAILAAGLLASPRQPAAATVDGIQAANVWVVDPAHSHLGFSGTQLGALFKGEFHTYDAAIVFDPAHPENAHVTVNIDMATARTGDTQRDAALLQTDWFDTARFPKATFEATGFRSKGNGAWETPGTLSIHGVRKEVLLPFTLALDGVTAHAKGRLELTRTSFGVGQGTWSSGQWVALEVGVDLDLIATRAP